MAANDPIARYHDCLRNVLARKDILPDAFGDFVAPIGGPPPESCSGLEKKSSALAPKSFSIRCVDDLRVQNIRKEDFPNLLRNSKGL